MITRGKGYPNQKEKGGWKGFSKIKGPPLTPTTEPLADNIMVDLNEKKRVLGLELLLPPTVKKEIKAN